MRWSVFIYDPKIIVLLIILVLFLILSITIIFWEVKVKKRSRIIFTQNIEETRINNLKNSLQKAKSSIEKLHALDKHAKSLFKERSNVNTKKSYSELSKEFKHRQLYEFAKFCDLMFEAYYAEAKLSDTKIKELISALTRLIREKTTYLDPAQYDPENILNEEKQKGKQNETLKNKHEKKFEEQRLLLDAKKSSVEQKEKALLDKKNLIEQKEKELAKKETQNKKLIKELEKKLHEQEEKIKKEEKIQQQIAQKISQTSNLQPKPILGFFRKKSKKVSKPKETKPHSVKKEEKKTSSETQQVKEWRESIETKPIMGKDWLKQQKKRK